MSRESLKFTREQHAQTVCALVIRELRLEIVAGPRRAIDALMAAAEPIVEQTGGTLITDALRSEIAECHRMIAARDVSKRRASMRVVNSRGGVS